MKAHSEKADVLCLLASFPGSSPTYCRILYCMWQRLGRSLGTRQMFAACLPKPYYSFKLDCMNRWGTNMQSKSSFNARLCISNICNIMYKTLHFQMSHRYCTYNVTYATVGWDVQKPKAKSNKHDQKGRAEELYQHENVHDSYLARQGRGWGCKDKTTCTYFYDIMRSQSTTFLCERRLLCNFSASWRVSSTKNYELMSLYSTILLY